MVTFNKFYFLKKNNFSNTQWLEEEVDNLSFHEFVFPLAYYCHHGSL